MRHVRSGTRQVALVTRRAPARRGYAASRVAYDARRRRVPLDSDGRFYRSVLVLDPCVFCGATERGGPAGGDARRVQVAADHIVPLGAGGVNAWENLAAACRACNGGKKDKPLLSYLLERRGDA